MSHFDRSLRSQFFLTGPRPCPYLPGRRERKLFTSLSGPDAAALHDELSLHGFRRSQNIAYRPACSGCSACVSIRVRASDFSPSRSQRRALTRNADIERRVLDAAPTDEQYALFMRYLEARHGDGGMTDMDVFDFAAMIEDSSVRTRVIEYRLREETNGDLEKIAADAVSPKPGRLIGACLTDLLADGLSLVYSFFDSDFQDRSLGQYIILDHIDIARNSGCPYVYLGYWVSGSEKMDYKKKFKPSEILSPEGWVPLPES